MRKSLAPCATRPLKCPASVRAISRPSSERWSLGACRTGRRQDMDLETVGQLGYKNMVLDEGLIIRLQVAFIFKKFC